MDKEINARRLRIKLINDADVTGQVNLDRNPGYERVSDMVTESSESFLVLFSANVRHKDLEQSLSYDTLFVNRDHIIYAAPEDD